MTDESVNEIFKEVIDMAVEFSDFKIEPYPLQPGKKVKVTCRITSPDGIESVKVYDPRGWVLTAYDDGTHGDEVAGDGIYTLVEDVPYDAPPGEYTATAVITDKKGNVTRKNFTIRVA